MLSITQRPVFTVTIGIVACLSQPYSPQAWSGERDRPDHTCSIAQVLLHAAGELDAGQVPTRDECRQELLLACRQTYDFLLSPDSDLNGAGWISYLQLDELIGSLEQNDTRSESIAAELERRLVGPVPGVEFPTIMRLRHSVRRYGDAPRSSDVERHTERLRGRLTEIANQCRESGDPLSRNSIQAISEAYACLVALDQPNSGADAVRDAFNLPNCKLSISEEFLRRTVQRRVNETIKIKDCILGTQLFGLASLEGDIHVDVKPSENEALLKVILNGKFSCRNRGYNGPVRLKTSSAADVQANRLVAIQGTGVTLSPAQIHTEFSSAVDAIEHPLRLVRRIAQQQAEKQKAEADQIAETKLQRRIEEQFIAQTNTCESFCPEELIEPLMPWFSRFDVPAPKQAWSSTEDSIEVHCHVAHEDQICSAMAPPEVEQPFAVAIQFHETAICNALNPWLAGQSITRSQLEMVSLASGNKSIADLPAELLMQSLAAWDVAPLIPVTEFQVDLAPTHPVIFEAREGALTIGFRASAISDSGETSPLRDVDIRAVYRPVHQAGGNYMLVRDDDVQATTSMAGADDDGHALLEQVKLMFGNLLPKTCLGESIALPAEELQSSSTGHSLITTKIESSDGWLTIVTSPLSPPLVATAN